MASDRKDTPAMRARTEYAYSNEVYGTLQRMLAKLLEAMPEKVRFTHRKFASSFQHSCMLCAHPPHECLQEHRALSFTITLLKMLYGT